MLFRITMSRFYAFEFSGPTITAVWFHSQNRCIFIFHVLPTKRIFFMFLHGPVIPLVRSRGKNIDCSIDTGRIWRNQIEVSVIGSRESIFMSPRLDVR